MNRILEDVRAAFDRISTHPTAITIDRTGIEFPAGGHFQGIQRIGDSRRLVITSSSDSQAYFVVCDIAEDWTKGRATPPVRVAPRPLKHAGGCQTAGSILVTGVEDNTQRRNSEVQFWQLDGPPAQITALTIERRGEAKVSTAGAVGISTYHGGSALAVATWDADTIDFYTTAAGPFQNPGQRFAFLETWAKISADRSQWSDPVFGSCQNVNLLTQRDGALYMIAFHRTANDEWMDLFQLDLNAPPAWILKKLAKKRMVCTNGCSFQAGSGVHIASPTAIEVLAVRGDSSAPVIHANLFRPQ